MKTSETENEITRKISSDEKTLKGLKELSELERAYLAGILDQAIWRLRKMKEKTTGTIYYNLSIQVSCTSDHNLGEWIANLWGGHGLKTYLVACKKDWKGRKNFKKYNCMRISIPIHAVRWIIWNLFPYLKFKKQHCELFKRMSLILKNKWHPVTKEEDEERKNIYNEFGEEVNKERLFTRTKKYLKGETKDKP